MELILRNQLGVTEYLWVPAPGKHCIRLMCPHLQPQLPELVHVVHLLLLLMITSKVAADFLMEFFNSP